MPKILQETYIDTGMVFIKLGNLSSAVTLWERTAWDEDLIGDQLEVTPLRSSRGLKRQRIYMLLCRYMTAVSRALSLLPGLPQYSLRLYSTHSEVPEPPSWRI